MPHSAASYPDNAIGSPSIAMNYVGMQVNPGRA